MPKTYQPTSPGRRNMDGRDFTRLTKGKKPEKSLTSGKNIATTHLVIEEEADHQGIIDAANRALAERFAIQHATIQVEHDELANKCHPCDPAA